MSDYEENFCKRVVKARTEFTDLTQDQMAAALEIGKSSYRHYEGGRMTMMPHRTIPKFCRITGVSEQWLVTGEGPVTTNEALSRINKKLKGMSDKQQEAFENMIDSIINSEQ